MQRCSASEKSDPAAAPSSKRARPDVTADDRHGQAGQRADTSRASEDRAERDEKKRKLEDRLSFGALAEKNREESAKRDEEKIKERQARGALAEKNREEKADKSRKQKAQREEKVCVAFLPPVRHWHLPWLSRRSCAS